MDPEYIKKPQCRICMHPEPIIDWNEELYENMSYKNCYYRYTNLDQISYDPFPQLLCGICADDLLSFHNMVEKAVQSQKLFEQRWEAFLESNIEKNTQSDYDKFYGVNKDTDTRRKRAVRKTCGIKELLEMEINIDDKEFESLTQSVINPEEIAALEEALLKETNQMELSCKKDSYSITKRQPETEQHLSDKFNILEYDNTSSSEKRSQTKNEQNTEEELLNNNETRIKKKRRMPPPAMCSYCSKLIYKPSHIKHHEATHLAERARDKVCTTCGFKTYTLTSLKSHMMIHEKNREKKYKCEFCDKAFFNRGACNVHRRIHLGLMLKCSLCPKEYSRQIDLDKHMVSHSHAPLHSSDIQVKRKKVQCNICKKIMNSTYFAAHRAAHLNEPLMKCTICEKDFFGRTSCMKHMRKVHKRTDKCEDIIFYYEKYRPRLTPLLREQQGLANIVYT
ncbi:uncharacterized protein LOC142227962 [Haematobia irritans]|uniref:uncharacterized protein LOC142227962 n=1 Tax=Haematobia irritans TaxID=7368 RepID=UPI003F4FED34